MSSMDDIIHIGHSARNVGLTHRLRLDGDYVTIKYKDRKTGQPRSCRLTGDEFMHRFLQHVLPSGFHKVRYFGLWHPRHRDNAARIKQMLQLEASTKAAVLQEPAVLSGAKEPDAAASPTVEPRVCPRCREGHLVFVRRLSPQQAMGP